MLKKALAFLVSLFAWRSGCLQSSGGFGLRERGVGGYGAWDERGGGQRREGKGGGGHHEEEHSVSN